MLYIKADTAGTSLHTVQHCLHCTTRQALNIVYDTAISWKKKYNGVTGKHFLLFNHAKLTILNELACGEKEGNT